jgi:hypothetical protein
MEMLMMNAYPMPVVIPGTPAAMRLLCMPDNVPPARGHSIAVSLPTAGGDNGLIDMSPTDLRT